MPYPSASSSSSAAAERGTTLRGLGSTAGITILFTSPLLVDTLWTLSYEGEGNMHSGVGKCK
jgi:hypothetical protein